MSEQNRPVEHHIQTVTSVERDNLQFVGSMVFGEVQTSEMLNSKDYGFKKSGIYLGATPEVVDGFKLKIAVDPKEGRSSVVVGLGTQLLTLIQQHDAVVEIPNGSKWYVVVEGFNQAGVKTRQVSADSEIDVGKILVVALENVTEEHVVLCSVDLTSNPSELNEVHIDTSMRVHRTYDVDDHIDADDPHPQYNTESETQGQIDKSLEPVNVAIDTKIAKESISSSTSSDEETTVASSRAVNEVRKEADAATKAAIAYTDKKYNQMMGDMPQEQLDTMTEIAEKFGETGDAVGAVMAETAKKVDKTSVTDNPDTLLDDKILSSKASRELAAQKANKKHAHGAEDLPAASTSAPGVSQLETSVISESETKGATPKSVKMANDNAEARVAKADVAQAVTGGESDKVPSVAAVKSGLDKKAERTHVHSAEQLPGASLEAPGISMLSNDVDSESETDAATSKAVKIVQDNANARVAKSDISQDDESISTSTVPSSAALSEGLGKKVSTSTEVRLGTGLGGSGDMSGPLIITPDYSTTEQRGIVQLNDTVSSNAVDQAATANAVRLVNENADSRISKSAIVTTIGRNQSDAEVPSAQAVFEIVDTKSDKDHTHTAGDVPTATLEHEGTTTLSNATNSDDQTKAATSRAVKIVNDNANSRISKSAISNAYDSIAEDTVASSLALKNGLATKANAKHSHVAEDLPAASISAPGISQLSSATTSTAVDKAATPAAVKVVQDNANSRISKSSISNSTSSTSTSTVASSKALNDVRLLAVGYLGDSKAYTDAMYQKILGDVPQETLDTFTEIAAKFNDTNDAFASVNSELAKKVDKASISSSISSTSATTVASSSAVKKAYDLAASKMTQATGDSRYLLAGATAVNANKLDNLDSTQFMRSDANDSIGGNTIWANGKGIGIGGSGGGRVPAPGGASLFDTTGNVSGAFKIKLPTASKGQSDMISFEVSIFDYAAGESVRLFIAAYQYGTVDWTNHTVTVLSGRTDRDLNVRFGNDGSSHCVWIGETNSSWSHPQVGVFNFMAGYSADIWKYIGGWSISRVTAFDTVQDTIRATRPVASVASVLEVSRRITLSGDASGYVDFKGDKNVTLQVTVADNSHSHGDLYYSKTESNNRYLLKGEKAVNSAKLDGLAASYGTGAATIAARDGSGDISARLFRSTYAPQSSAPAASANIMFQNNNTSDNYIRSMTKAAMKSWLTLGKADVGLSNVPNYAFTTSVSDSSTTKFASASAVRVAYNLAAGKLSQSTADQRYALKSETSSQAAKVTVNHSTSAAWYPVVWHNNSNTLYDTTEKLMFHPGTGSLKASGDIVGKYVRSAEDDLGGTLELGQWRGESGSALHYNGNQPMGIVFNEDTIMISAGLDGADDDVSIYSGYLSCRGTIEAREYLKAGRTLRCMGFDEYGNNIDDMVIGTHSIEGDPVQGMAMGNKGIYFDGGIYLSTTFGSGDFDLAIYSNRIQINQKTNITNHLSVSYDVTARAYLYNSDSRKKDNIVDLSLDLAKEIYEDLVPKTYNFKDTGRKSYGFLADKMAEKYPHLVEKGEDDCYSLNYIDLISPTVRMVKHLMDENEAKDLKIKRLEERMAKFEDRLKALGV